MFFALLSPWHSESSISTFSPFLFVTLDNAIYNWPWQKTCFDKYNPTVFRDWPWLLFMVIAKQTERGYCLLFSTNGHLESLGDIMIRGMYTFWPTCVSVIIFASMYLFPSWVIVILVPLHKPADWLMFWRSITGRPTFSLSSWFGIPGNFKLMRNVVGFHAAACRCFAHVVWAMVHHFFAFYLAHYVLIYLSYHFVFFACILFSQGILGLGS